MTQDKKETDNSNPEQTAETTVGALLRKTRLAKKQDLRDIASYLCIRYQFLEALEEGRYKDLPGDAYANGFVRSYAAYLGLNPADIITRYKQEYFNHTKRENEAYIMSPEDAENIVPDSKILFVSVVLLLTAFGLWHVFSKDREGVAPLPETAGQTEVVADSISIVEQSYPLPVEESDAVKNASGKKAADKPVAPVPPVPPVKPETGDKQDTAAPENSAVETAPVEKQPEADEKQQEPAEPRVFGQRNYNPRLILVAKEETWIEVTRGETVLFSRLLNPGDRYMVSSVNPEELFLKTGNAGGLEIYCDGMLTQSLGPRGALRSNIALIPDDFAAKVVENIE